MRRLYRRPTGDVSRRLRGAMLDLQRRERAARVASLAAQQRGRVEFAASLRGKARAYHEAFVLLDRLDRGMPLRRRRWWSE